MRSDIVIEDTSTLLATMRDRFTALAAAAVAARGRFDFAVPGGSVAEAFFPRLVRAGLDWRRTHVFWVDERCVPPTDAESNYGRARVLLLEPLHVAADQVHGMAGATADVERAADAAERALVEVLGDPPRVDLAILGVGPDGHVASLFPGHPALAERARFVRAVDGAPKPPPQRLTWTLQALAAARALWVVAFGHAKSAPIAAALAGPVANRVRSPLALAVRSGPPVTFFLDPEAGAGVR
jgi:6-phosphogluconolactonase